MLSAVHAVSMDFGVEHLANLAGSGAECNEGPAFRGRIDAESLPVQPTLTRA
jgi:hypothetical protein